MNFSHEALFNLEATDEELIEQLTLFLQKDGTGFQLVQMIMLAPKAGLHNHSNRILNLLETNDTLKNLNKIEN